MAEIAGAAARVALAVVEGVDEALAASGARRARRPRPPSSLDNLYFVVLSASPAMPSDAGSAARLQIGQRVSLRGSKRVGTVRFIGPVDGTAGGEWAGIDFDDGNGKHDGSRAGVRYFECVEGPTSGSFVRPAHLSAGVSAHAALVSRYAAEPGPSSYGSGFGKRIEAIGLESVAKRVGQLSTLRIISLAHEDVNGVGSAEDEEMLRRDAASVQSLDLSSSLIASWEDLAAVVDAMPRLTFLVARSACATRRALTTQRQSLRRHPAAMRFLAPFRATIRAAPQSLPHRLGRRACTNEATELTCRSSRLRAPSRRSNICSWPRTASSSSQSPSWTSSAACASSAYKATGCRAGRAFVHLCRNCQRLSHSSGLADKEGSPC